MVLVIAALYVRVQIVNHMARIAVDNVRSKILYFQVQAFYAYIEYTNTRLWMCAKHIETHLVPVRFFISVLILAVRMTI